MKKRMHLILLCAGLGLTACLGVKHVTTIEAPTPEKAQLISREVLFGNPDRAGVRISPDGSKMGYLAPVNGVMNVWIGPTDDLKSARPVTHDTKRGIRSYFWCFTNKHIVYLQDKEGDENWRLHCVDLESGRERDLTPLEGINAQVEEVSPEFPEKILVGLNDRVPQFHDLYSVNIVSGERELVQKNDEFAFFATDDDFRIRLAGKMTPVGGLEFYRPDGKGGWGLYEKIPSEDMMTTSLSGVDKAGDVIYMTDSRGRNTGALYSVNLNTGERKLLAENPKADAGAVLIHPTKKTVQAVEFEYLRSEWEILDKSIEKDWAYLRTVADGDMQIISRTLDDRTWIVVYLMDDGPVRYYKYDRDAGKAEFLFTNRKALEGLPLVKMQPVVIKTRDGLDMVSYLTLPPGSDSDGDGRPDAAQPMVLVVHGGPWGRDTWGYNSLHQWLANRGYAVLSPNFRGSTGFGKAFVNAGDKAWGRKMHDDLIDAVEWAAGEGIADKARVAIYGGSYGGYATLAGLTFTPDVFACGVDIVGPSNLVTLLQSVPPYWKPMLDLFTTRVGDHRTSEGQAFLKERSPLTYADRICKPLLIGQGANDPRVKQAEADQIVNAMREKGLPVTYVLYPDEGHGFARPENRMSFNAVAEAFLAGQLGGRYEPVGDDFKGSSIKVPEGAQYVPGLKAALVGAERETP